jgi:D-alanyl-D-alanine carboxypeptidase/D-alanyl-D-alanine-endopeptidase (penicillin-binding protein 4)
MKLIHRVAVSVLLTTIWVWALPQGIEALISKVGVPQKDVSLYIKEAGEKGSVVASLNADKLRTPASVIKVLTTYAAVLKLGFDYRWPTQFYIRGKYRNGVLKGDLIVKGFGDPTLDAEDLDDIVSKIKAHGIRKIIGHIVIDRTYFKVSSKNSSHFDENPYSPYNAMPDAMMFNERVSTICVTPNKNSVTKKYPDRSYIVHNELKQVNKPCRGRYSWPHIKIDDSKRVPEVWLKGKISKRCGKREICRVVTKPYLSFFYALQEKLNASGISATGTMRLGKVPYDAQILFIHYSKPLEKIIAKTAKKSNNLYARHLLLFLGAKMYGAPATLQKGRRAVKAILRAHGVKGIDTVKIDNGSGLSRSAKLTAKVLANMLDDAYERYGMHWMKTLSIAGVDGTIKRRFRGTVVRKRAWMKTGTLKRVKNIAGYVKSKKGNYYTTVIIVNTRVGRWKAAQLQNEIIKWLVLHAPVLTKVKTPKVDVSGEYVIQAGVFTYEPSETYLSKIADMGYRYHVKHADEYKVLIGPFRHEAEAKEALGQIRQQISPQAFIQHPVAKYKKNKP